MACIYVRVSLDATGERLAVDRQLLACQALATTRGWSVAEVYSDNSVSASKGVGTRPEYERMMTDLNLGRFGVIIAWHVDRLTRSLTELEQLITFADDRGLVIATVNGDVDLSTDSGRLVGRILATVARGEVERKSARQRAANEQRAKAGKPQRGRRPFGYDDDGVTLRVDESAAVRRGFNDFLAGVPLGAIARDWNALGLRTGQRQRKGFDAGQPGLWRRDNVRVVLANPRYAGLRARHGEVVAPALWPAIVDEETWRAAAALLADPTRRRAPRSARGLLSGIATCGVCGLTVHGGAGRTGYRTIRCSSNQHVARQAVPIEDWVEEFLIGRLAAADAVDLMRVSAGTVDVAELRAESAALLARLDSLAVEFADGELTPAQVRVATDRLREKLGAVDAQLVDAGRVDILGPIVNADDVAATWDASTVDRKRAVIDLLYSVVIAPVGRGRTGVVPGSVTMNPRL